MLWTKLRAGVFLFLIAAGVLVGAFFYVRSQIIYGRNALEQSIFIQIEKGEDAVAVGKKLKNARAINSWQYFVFYLWQEGKLHALKSGEFRIAKNATIVEIVDELLTASGRRELKVTFPEGWTAKEMAARLKDNGFDADGFLTLVERPVEQQWKGKYTFLASEEVLSLQGYLFPDTYIFTPEATPEQIIDKMLANFERKFTEGMRLEAQKNGRSIAEIVTMASIIEGEVISQKDRALVSGIFWRRISQGMPLQSCATLAYALGEKKAQYSLEDTQVDSPYNTYRNKGLPPGPVSNPGLVALSAALRPQSSEYLFFLSDPRNGQTVFARTFEEHSANKARVGL